MRKLSLHKCTIPEFKDALRLLVFIAIESHSTAVKDVGKRLQCSPVCQPMVDFLNAEVDNSRKTY